MWYCQRYWSVKTVQIKYRWPNFTCKDELYSRLQIQRLYRCKFTFTLLILSPDMPIQLAQEYCCGWLNSLVVNKTPYMVQRLCLLCKSTVYYQGSGNWLKQVCMWSEFWTFRLLNMLTLSTKCVNSAIIYFCLASFLFFKKNIGDWNLIIKCHTPSP